MNTATFGMTGVDWENRLDMDRLRRERLSKLKIELERSDLAALLTFDFHNIRYMTATHIGTWAMDKMIRFALLPRGGDPVIWDFGSAARHHQLYTPWLDEPHDAAGRGRALRRAGRNLHTARGNLAGSRAGRGRRRQGLRGAGRLRAGRPAGSASTSSSRRCFSPCRQRALTSSTASRCSSRLAGSRLGTRSACSPRPSRWSTRPTRISTSSCVPAFARTNASGWSARSCSTSARSTSRA